MTDALRLVCRVIILAVAILAGTAFPGDEDSRPAYMIYIDPETGKYTTEDPEVVNKKDTVVPVKPTSGNSQLTFPLLIAGGCALVVLLVGGLLKHQRRQHLSRL